MKTWLKAAACMALRLPALAPALGIGVSAETFLSSHHICFISSATLGLRPWAGGSWAHSPFPWWCCLSSRLAPGTTVAGAAPSTPHRHVTRGQENTSGGAKRVGFSASKSPLQFTHYFDVMCDDEQQLPVAKRKGNCFENQRRLPLHPPPGCGCWMLYGDGEPKCHDLSGSLQY